jgi:hypothetical protein
MTVGQSFKATHVDGELHSFTEVDAFGRGSDPLLNQLSNSSPTRPECGTVFAASKPELLTLVRAPRPRRNVTG